MSDLPFHHPLLLIGGLAAADRDRVRDFALSLNAPTYAEPLSGLREDAAIQRLSITAGERMLARATFDGVVRIGSVPTLRFWRDLEDAHASVPVLSYARTRFAGLSRGEVRSIDELPRVAARDTDERLMAEDRRMASRIAGILEAEPESELAMLRALSHDLPARSRIYLGNSLPIREWDLVATRDDRGFTYEANRGANGIDGQLSTFFGWCAEGAENVAIVGDLTALYDLNAPWIASQLGEVRFRIVIVNNGGGRIFSRVASLKNVDRRLMENVHSLRFEKWAAMWGLAYDDPAAAQGVIELLPDLDATQRAWQRYDALWS